MELSISFFRTYSEAGKELENMLLETLPGFFKKEFKLDVNLSVHDSKGLSQEEGNSPYQVLTSIFNNKIVIIDGSLEEISGYKLGVNYECVTPAISSFDNVLIVSRTQLPLNLIVNRTNVANLGETDLLNIDNDKCGYKKQYTNKQILDWLFAELISMHKNGRLVRSNNLIVDMNLPVDALMKQEFSVMEENIEALKIEKEEMDSNKRPRKHIFISYRSKYSGGRKYKGKYDIIDMVNIIKKYHEELGDNDEFKEPFYYPNGVLSNEFMPEIRRWAFVSIPDRKIRECNEFWIFNTKSSSCTINDENGEVGYWDSWWCLGEFLTLVRMKHQNVLKPDFKIMLFDPDTEVIREIKHSELPQMTETQARELARYFANGDFLEAGLENLDGMRQKRSWSKLRRYLFFIFMKKIIWPKVAKNMDFSDYPFKYFEESISSHVYDEGFYHNRIISCKCSAQGYSFEDICNDKDLIWNFLNINDEYTAKYHLRPPKGIIRVDDRKLEEYLQQDGRYRFECENGHSIYVRKSEDKFYIFWTPRMGNPTGPNGCIIETVNLYEIVSDNQS